MSNTTLFILFLISFIVLTYTIIILFKRKEYENPRIFQGYNLLLFGIVSLALSTLIKAVKFGFLSFNENLIIDFLIYFDVVTNLILIPLFGVSYLVSMMAFKEI